MKFSLSPSQFQILEHLAIAPLREAHAKIYVFGSRSRGDHHLFSDLDLLIKESNTHPLSDTLLSKIREDLEESNLTIKVDLVNDKYLSSVYRPFVEKDLVEII